MTRILGEHGNLIEFRLETLYGPLLYALLLLTVAPYGSLPQCQVLLRHCKFAVPIFKTSATSHQTVPRHRYFDLLREYLELYGFFQAIFCLQYNVVVFPSPSMLPIPISNTEVSVPKIQYPLTTHKEIEHRNVI